MEKNCFAFCLIALLLFSWALVVNSVLAGFVLHNLWAWFMMPLGISAISIFHAMGIMSVFNVFTSGILLTMVHNQQNKEEDPDKALWKVAGLVFGSTAGFLTIWLVGYIEYYLMTVYPGF